MKILLFIISIICLTVSAKAQLIEEGFKVGIQSVRLQSFDDTFDFYDTEAKLGFNVFVYSEWKINSLLTTEVQLGYNLRGFSNSLVFTDIETQQKIGEARAKTNLHYVSTAAFLKLNYNISNQGFYSGIGPRFEFLLSSKSGSYEHTSGRIPESFIISRKDNTAELLDNFLIGVSVITGLKKVTLFSKDIGFEIRYDIDITDSMSKHPRDAQNEAFVLSMVYEWK